MDFLLISPKNRTVYNFRGELIRAIQEKGYAVTVTGPDQTDMEKIRALGVEFVEIPMNKTGTSIAGDLKYCKQLYALMKRTKPDAVLGYTIKPVVYGTIAGWLAGVKQINCMVTGGGYTFTAKTAKARALGLLVRNLYKIAFRHCHRVIFQNPDDQKEFVTRGLVKESKCRVVNGSGVDMGRFEPAPYPAELRFFMLSRLLKSKGVLEYLQAAEQVKKNHPEVSFAILGKYEDKMQDAVEKSYAILGKYEDKMQDAVEKSYVEGLIQSGVIERYEETSDVRPYYAACSVYVLPSYREGTPRTVLEAMAMARPIITTDANGCRETVLDGKTGFLIPVQDVQALADRMLYFIEHPERIPAMGQASLDYCREKFEVSNVNRMMLQYMEI